MDDEKEVAREQFMEQEIATLEQIKINLLIAVIVKSQYLKVQDMIKTFVYIFQLTAQEQLKLQDQYLTLTHRQGKQQRQ